MAKQLKPEMGYNVRTMLTREIDNVKSRPQSDFEEDRVLVMLQLRQLVNQSTCVTHDQLHDLDLMKIFPLSNSGKESQELIVEAGELAPIVNAYRLECRDCLNGDCPLRDPDSPIEEVKRKVQEPI
ncbi:hypothetical protein KKA95_04460 [Patescibacteria group bacterium]|nr:hypothetical protein [Patescibacteria group bacterium]